MTHLKFRAWDCEEKVMLQPESIQGWEVIHLMHNETHAIMQSTGLLDRNEKEIFEGDIVRHHKHWSDGREVSVVEWDAEAAQFFPFGTSDWSIDGKETEVIGNIHQHPDLLTSPL